MAVVRGKAPVEVSGPIWDEEATANAPPIIASDPLSKYVPSRHPLPLTRPGNRIAITACNMASSRNVASQEFNSTSVGCAPSNSTNTSAQSII